MNSEELLEELMLEFVFDEKCDQWLRTPLLALGGRSPQEMMASGQIEAVTRDLWQLREGMPL